MTSATQEHLGIAIVDDDAVFREVTCAMLSSGSAFVPFPAASSDDLFAVLSQQRIDCIVLDYHLGDSNGLSIKNQVDHLFPEPPPIVMLTGDGRESTVIKAFRMGVNDYLPKHNLQPKSLVSTIARVVDSNRERLFQIAEYKRLRDASTIDLVSGLLGRIQLDARLRQLQCLPSESRRSYAVIVIEMLEFPSIVQNVGIKAGDAAIRAFGKQLKTMTRSQDICGRYEDGIFLVIADVKADAGLLTTICSRLAANMRLVIDLDAAKLVLNGCVASALCDTGDTPSDLDTACLLHSAFSSLAKAKAEGTSFAVASMIEMKARPDAISGGSATPVAERAQALPAAEQLRTGDRRGEPRQRVFKRGVVHLQGTQSTFNCTVRNTSASGAGLRLDTPFAAPSEFDFEIIGTGTRRRAVVRWQAGTDFGISFNPSDEPTPR